MCCPLLVILVVTSKIQLKRQQEAVRATKKKKKEYETKLNLLHLLHSPITVHSVRDFLKINYAIIETGLWRRLISHDCSMNFALGFPGSRLLFHPLYPLCGCHRELQAPLGARAAGGCSAAWPERNFGVKFHMPRCGVGQGSVCRPVLSVCDPCGAMAAWQPLGHGGRGSPAFAGGCDAHSRLASAL